MRRRQSTAPPTPTTTTSSPDDWSSVSEATDEFEAAVYEPVVLKLELHFAPRQATNRTRPHRHRHGERKNDETEKGKKKKKRKKKLGRQRTTSNGFIHLFLPLQFGARLSPVKLSLGGEAPERRPARKKTTTTTTTTTPAPTTTTTTTIASVTRRNKGQSKRKKNKKMNNTLIESPTASLGAGEEIATGRPPMRKHQQNWGLADDGIPPVLNSLSSEETQQWARWLRCTLCLQQVSASR